MKTLSAIERDGVRLAIPSPGASLIRNPFGSSSCYFYGLFYPFAENAIIKHAQQLLMDSTRENGKAWVFSGDQSEIVDVLEGDLDSMLLNRCLDTEGFYDINVFMPRTGKAFCISQEERLFLSSVPPYYLQNADVDFDEKSFSLAAEESISTIREYVRLLESIIDNQVTYSN